jgi:hypothetical protein
VPAVLGRLCKQGCEFADELLDPCSLLASKFTIKISGEFIFVAAGCAVDENILTAELDLLLMEASYSLGGRRRTMSRLHQGALRM